jgi:hypothetical protein
MTADSRTGQRGVVVDRLDVELEDAELLSEVELTAALIVAANQAERHLSDDEVDAIHGLSASTAEPSQA